MIVHPVGSSTVSILETGKHGGKGSETSVYSVTFRGNGQSYTYTTTNLSGKGDEAERTLLTHVLSLLDGFRAGTDNPMHFPDWMREAF